MWKKKILIIITGMGIEAQIHFLIPSLCSLASSQMIVSLNVAKREEVEWELIACFFRAPCRPDLPYQSRVLDRPLGIPGGTTGKNPACQCRRLKRHGFNPWVRKIPWRRTWQPTPVFLPGESHRGAWWATVHWLHRVGHDWSNFARMHWLSSSLTGQPSWPEVTLWGWTTGWELCFLSILRASSGLAVLPGVRLSDWHTILYFSAELLEGPGWHRDSWGSEGRSEVRGSLVRGWEKQLPYGGVEVREIHKSRSHCELLPQTRGTPKRGLLSHGNPLLFPSWGDGWPGNESRSSVSSPGHCHGNLSFSSLQSHTQTTFYTVFKVGEVREFKLSGVIWTFHQRSNLAVVLSI